MRFKEYDYDFGYSTLEIASDWTIGKLILPIEVGKRLLNIGLLLKYYKFQITLKRLDWV